MLGQLLVHRITRQPRIASSSHLNGARCPTILLTSFFLPTNATAKYFMAWPLTIAVASRNA
jgi:hypothetical protein